VPLRRRLSWVVAAVAVAAVLVSASAAWIGARSVMRDNVDDALQAQADVVLDAKSTTRGMVLRARDGSGRLLVLPEPPARQGGPAEYAQTLAADGTIITTRGDVTLPVTAADLAAIATGALPEARDARIGDAHLRILTVPLTGAAAARFDAVAVQVARPLNGVDRALRTLWIVLLVVGVFTVLTAVLVARTFARRTILRPIHDLTSAVDHVEQTADLVPRIPVHNDDELGDLTRHFNAMLDRLEQYRGELERSVGEQRNLIADASHELRTPVTSLRMNAELLLDHHDELPEQDRQEVLNAVCDQTQVLTNLVTDLIELARGDQPDGRDDESVDLDAVVRSCLGHAERDHREIAFRARLADATVRGRPDRLARAITNLLNNAALHGARDGDTIDVTMEVEGAAVAVRVIDHGPGVPAAERERIFDRFRRGDDARRRTGSGLGLAIVRQVAVSHGGAIEVDETPGGGATFTLRLPLTPDAD
jgi:two-component system sensor histidine kinase MprB